MSAPLTARPSLKSLARKHLEQKSGRTFERTLPAPLTDEPRTLPTPLPVQMCAEPPVPTVAPKPPADAEDAVRESVEERAAIMEFDAGLPRSEAEQIAQLASVLAA